MTPQEVIEAFWKDKAAVAAESNIRLASFHAKYFGEPLLKHAGDFLKCTKAEGVVEGVKELFDGVAVIVREPLASNSVRKRYRLCADGESWKITSIEWECIHCGGTGNVNGLSCQMCLGDGYEPRNNAA
jgi:hypothetical protein